MFRLINYYSSTLLRTYNHRALLYKRRMPTIRVLLFAAAREAAGNVSSVDIELVDDSADTAVLRKVCRCSGFSSSIFCLFLLVWLFVSVTLCECVSIYSVHTFESHNTCILSAWTRPSSATDGLWQRNFQNCHH